MVKQSEEFKSFFQILIFCMTSRNMRSIRGNYRTSNIVIFLTIYLIVYITLATYQLIYDLYNPNIKDITKILTIFMLLGFAQIIVKNLGGIILHEKFVEIVDWIQVLNEEVDDNRVVQKIVDDELKRVVKFSMIFLKTVVLMFNIAVVSLIVSLAWDNSVACRFPGFEGVPNPNIYILYLIYQEIHTCIAATWSCFADSSIVFIGLYMISYVRIINRMIKFMNDDTDISKCPSDLLFRSMKNHIEMIRILGLFNDAVKIMSFLQIVMSVFMNLILFFGIQMYYTEISLYSLFVCAISQLCLLCVFGQLIKTQTEEIFWNLYLTNWYDFDSKNKQVLLLMMTISYREIGLKAAGMYDVSLMALVQIMKLSLSYTAIFFTLTDN
ncbi:hypothetical protein DMENIID0001_048500 [Sergentomyia squamirostris]